MKNIDNHTDDLIQDLFDNTRPLSELDLDSLAKSIESVLHEDYIIRELIFNEGYFTWETDDDHWDNSETMSEFIEDYLPYEFKVTLQDGAYAEVYYNNITYGIHASVCGDSYSHMVEFEMV